MQQDAAKMDQDGAILAQRKGLARFDPSICGEIGSPGRGVGGKGTVKQLKRGIIRGSNMPWAVGPANFSLLYQEKDKRI